MTSASPYDSWSTSTGWKLSETPVPGTAKEIGGHDQTGNCMPLKHAAMTGVAMATIGSTTISTSALMIHAAGSLPLGVSTSVKGLTPVMATHSSVPSIPSAKLAL